MQTLDLDIHQLSELAAFSIGIEHLVSVATMWLKQEL